MSKSLCAIAALAAAAILTVPTVAQAQGRDSVTVGYADLNLANAVGAKALERRIAAAAHALCGDAGGRDLALNQAFDACRSDAVASAAPAFAAAVRAASGGKATVIATTASLIVSR